MSDIIYKSISFKTLKSQEGIKWESIKWNNRLYPVQKRNSKAIFYR